MSMTHSKIPPRSENNKKSHLGFQSLHDEIDRVFDNFREGFSEFSEMFERKETGFLTPKMDVSENDKTLNISAELPGLSEGDIDVSVTDDILVITMYSEHQHCYVRM